MIFTSYFAKMKNLPDNVIPVAISLTVPQGVHCLRFKGLAPSGAMLKCYKTENNVSAYSDMYTKDVLGKFTAKDVLDALYQLLPVDIRVTYGLDQDTWYLSNEIHICLLCWERADKFCHRHVVSRWLTENGIPCNEYRF